MEGNYRRPMDFGGDQQGLLSRIRDLLTSNSLQSNPSRSELRPASTGGEKVASEESYRTGGQQSEVGRVLQHFLLDHKEDGGPSPHPELTTPKPAFSQEILQDGSRRIYCEVPRRRSMGGLNRSNRCLSTHSHQGEPYEVPSVRPVKWGHLPVQVPLFWSENCPQSVHQSYGRGGGSHAQSGYHNVPIFGRLAASPSEQRNAFVAAGQPGETSNFVGLDGQLGQVRHHPFEAVRVPGSPVRSAAGETFPITGQIAALTGSNFCSTREEGESGSRMAPSSGGDSFLRGHRSLGAPENASTATLCTVPVEAEQQGPVGQNQSASACGTAFTLVDTENQPDGRCTSPSTSSPAHNENRRVHELGVGRIHCQRTIRSGQMVSGGQKEAHQLAGAQGRVELPVTIQTAGDEQKCFTTDRQHLSSPLPEQTGRNQIHLPLLSGMGGAPMVSETQCFNQSSTSGGDQQRVSRSALKTESLSHGMGSEINRSKEPLLHTGKTKHRSVCVQSKHTASNLLLLETGARGVRHGRSNPVMGRHVRVCLSPDSTHTDGTNQGSARQMQNDPDSTSMATKKLVPEATGVAFAGTSNIAGSARSAKSTQGQSVAPRAGNIQLGSMASVRKSLRCKGFSKVTSKLIANAVRTSTRAVYKCRFEEFVRWCTRREVDPFRTDIVTIANFLGTLYKKNLSHSTIAGYRSAISSYLDPIDGFRVGDHPTLTRTVKGVFTLRPPARTLAPSWNLTKVLKKLRGPPFEPFLDVGLKWVSLKTAFLIALATAGRKSDISKLGCFEPHIRYEKNPVGIRFVPRTLRKQDRVGHAFKDVFVSSFPEDRLLDPVRAIKLYLKRVQARRGNLKSLLVTYGAGEVKSPTQQTIGHWVVDAIKEAYEGSTPGHVKAHSTRSVSTTVALLKGVSLENILRAADWSTESTFANHYLKEYRTAETEFARAVLGAATAE